MQIEKGIPCPPAKKARTELSATAKKMDVGDSILCDKWSDADIVRYTIARQGWKAASRKLAEGWRVWRVE